MPSMLIFQELSASDSSRALDSILIALKQSCIRNTWRQVWLELGSIGSCGVRGIDGYYV